MTSTSLNTMSASELARRLSRREITAEQAVMASLARIELRESHVGAWTCVAADAALARARELDQSPVRGLLHGLPLGIKDVFDTVDFPTEYGSSIHRGNRPAADSAVAALCKEAGAVVIGKTTTTEFAVVAPAGTRNPRRLAHTPGGSSSGSAAAVADWMVPLAVGTQTGSSTIRPAAFCGVVGYKPTFGLGARAGIKSVSESLDTVGFFARTVQDVGLLAAAASGDTRLLDTQAQGAPRFAVCRTHEWPQADADTQAVMSEAESGLAGAGASVGELILPQLYSLLGQAQIEIQAFEMVRALAYERINHRARISERLAAMLDQGRWISAERHEMNCALADKARCLIGDCFGDRDVLIAPSTIGEAPPGLDDTGSPVFCRMWTLLGLPCVHVPFTVSRTGLPMGLQVIGRRGADREALQAAAWMHTRLTGDPNVEQ